MIIFFFFFIGSWWGLFHDISVSGPWVWWCSWSLFLFGHNLCCCHVHTGSNWNISGQSHYYDNIHTMIQTPKWSSSENNHSSTLIFYRNTWFLRLPYSILQIFMQGVVRCWITWGCTAQYVWVLWLWLSLWGSSMSTN